MARFRKGLIAAGGAAAATIGWLINPSVVPSEVVAGAWLLAAGVFGVSNKAG